MEQDRILQQLADTHNLLINISVKGNDAIAMATVLQRLRDLIMQLQDTKEGQ